MVSASLESHSAPFRLMDLPPELREDIYRHALTARTITLLRTSQQIYHEASKILYREIPFRIDIRIIDQEMKFIPHHFRAGSYSSIQNLDLHVDIGGGTPTKDLGSADLICLNWFLAHPRLRTCTILLPPKKDFPWLRKRLDPLFAGLTSLTRFDQVFFALLPRPVEDFRRVPRPRSDVSGISYLRTVPRLRLGVSEIWYSNLFVFVRRLLEPRLGPARFHGGDFQEGKCLGFEPRRYLASLEVQSSPSPQSIQSSA